MAAISRRQGASFPGLFPKPGGALTKKKRLKGCIKKLEIPTENKKSRRTLTHIPDSEATPVFVVCNPLSN